MKKLLLLLLLVTINVTAQGNPDKFRDGIKTPFTKYDELTTTQKLALPQDKGTVVYDTDLEKLQVFDGVNWVGFFNAALDTTDDIIEGNTNKFFTVYDRAKFDNIVFDDLRGVQKIGRNTGQNATGTNLTATGVNAASNTTSNSITATGASAALGATGTGITATGANSATNASGNFITATGINAAQNAIGQGITSVGFAAGLFPIGNTLQTPNSTAIGAGTIIDKANQAAIGDAAVTELKIGETLVIDKSQIVTGAEGFLVTKKVGGKTVVEVSNDIQNQINSIQFEGVKTYQSLSALPDPLNLPDGLASKVSNDTTETNNGYYSVVSGVWVKDSDIHENIVEETNTTKGVTGKAVFDFVDPLFNDFSDLKYRYRKNKFLTFDTVSRKLKVVGSDSAQSSDEQIFTIFYKGVNYIFKGIAGSEHPLPIGNGNCQIGILTTVSDPSNVTLSDFVYYNDANYHANFIKLAHVTYNDGITSEIIKDYRNFYPFLRNFIENQSSNFVFNESIRNRKRKWISYDRFDKKLKVVGSDSAAPGDELIVTLKISGISYFIKGFVGDEFQTTLESGNTQIFISKSIPDPNNIHISDFEIFNDAIDRSLTHIKLAHITYNDRIDSNFIIDYQDYISEFKSSLQIESPSSFVNNSIGENCFANGLRTELKILGFGNSFMRNSVHLLSSMANGAGVNLTVGNLYTGGTNLQDHLNAMNNDSALYGWYKYENGVNTISQGSQTPQTGLRNERWDVVILHQYTPWTQGMQPLLSQVMAKIIDILGYCPKFYVNSTWGWDETLFPFGSGFTSEEEHSLYMLNAAENACDDGGIIRASIIPTGTAIQNARTLSYSDSYNRFVNAQGDFHHLNSAGGFIAACTIYQKIIFPLNGINCSNTSFRINLPQPLPPSTLNDNGIVVTDSNFLDFCKSAIDACENPNQVTRQ